MKVGTPSPSGIHWMTARTREKLQENTDQLIKNLGMDSDTASTVVYNALLWTADDVLAQCVADGYVSTEEGVL